MKQEEGLSAITLEPSYKLLHDMRCIECMDRIAYSDKRKTSGDGSSSNDEVMLHIIVSTPRALAYSLATFSVLPVPEKT